MLTWPRGMGKDHRVRRTLIFFHAHPDDEALLTAGSMARAAAEGHRVVLVVATAGDVGLVGGGVLAAGETLAERRVAELRASAEVLGVERVVLLGYGDSGSDPGSLVDGGFATVPLEEAAGRLAAVLTEVGADVLVTYDRNGGYGHPDHVRVHLVGARAAELARTPLVLEATASRELLQMGVELAAGLGHPVPEDFAPTQLDHWFLPEAEITTFVDVSEHLAAKRAAMAAHASQTTGPDQETDGSNVRTLAAFLALPDELFALGFGTEWYRRRGAEPGTREDDILAGLADPPGGPGAPSRGEDPAAGARLE